MLENPMKRQLFFLAFIISLFFLLIQSCKEESLIVNNNKLELPAGISGLTTFKYEYLGTAPIHTQTSMLTGHNNKIYRFGSKWFQVFDKNSKSWSQIILPDSSFWRWDGAAVTIDDDVYIVAVSTTSKSYDILKYNTQTLNLEHTGTELPVDFHYPAYCVYDKNILFLSRSTDSIYLYNTNNNNLSTISKNPFLSSDGTNMTLSSGKHNNYFYIFGGYSHLADNLFYRLNLNTYQWEKIEIPNIIENSGMIGASFKDSFIFFADSNLTYEYNFVDGNWRQDTSMVPLYSRNLSGNLWIGETSFYTDDSTLYATDILSEIVWEITK